MIQIQSNTKYSITTRTLTLIVQNTEQFCQHKEPSCCSYNLALPCSLYYAFHAPSLVL